MRGPSTTSEILGIMRRCPDDEYLAKQFQLILTHTKPNTIRQAIIKLRKAGMIVKSGSTRDSRWRLTEKGKNT